jgi:hypothetical protein
MILEFGIAVYIVDPLYNTENIYYTKRYGV